MAILLYISRGQLFIRRMSRVLPNIHDTFGPIHEFKTTYCFGIGEPECLSIQENFVSEFSQCQDE